jgi:hypothetical protein
MKDKGLEHGWTIGEEVGKLYDLVLEATRRWAARLAHQPCDSPPVL